MDAFTTALNKSAYGLLALTGTALLSWSIWITQYAFQLERELNNLPTEDRVHQAIALQSPYIEDRKLINQTLMDTKAALQAVSNTISNNTQAITELKVFLKDKERQNETP